MTKYEFLNDLKAALTGNVSGDIISENMQYYDEYIAGEVRKGKTEEEVLGALRDPRLIARTITDTKGNNVTQSTYADESWEEEGSSGTGYRSFTSEKKKSRRRTQGVSAETSRKIRFYLTIALILILIVLLVGFLVTAVGALLYIFWPVLLVLILVHLMTRNNRYR